MGTSKHEDRVNPKLDEDLKRNPGIGQGAGTSQSGGDAKPIEGENTVEGDVDNNAGRYGQVKTGRERTNA